MKIALVQARIAWGNVRENLKQFGERLSGVCGADVIVLPEMFTSGYMSMSGNGQDVAACLAAYAGGYEQVREKMKRWAQEAGAVVMGSTVYGEAGRFYNRLLVAFPDGRCLHYDKKHCFMLGGESKYFSSGQQQLVFDYKGVRFAGFICYDLRFPVWCRNVQDYDVAFFVANWPESRREVWNTLLRARAIENQCFVVGVNCVGTDMAGLVYAGDSAVIDARGGVAGRCADYEDEVKCVEIDVEKLREFRKSFPVLGDRDNFEILP